MKSQYMTTGPDLAPRQDEAGPHLTFQTPRQDGAGGPPHLRWGKERAHATPQVRRGGGFTQAGIWKKLIFHWNSKYWPYYNFVPKKNRRLSFLTGKSSSYSINQLLSTYLLKFSPTLIFMCQGSESKTGSICYFNWTRNFLAVIRAIATNLTFHGFFVKIVICPF